LCSAVWMPLGTCTCVVSFSCCLVVSCVGRGPAMGPYSDQEVLHNAQMIYIFGILNRNRPETVGDKKQYIWIFLVSFKLRKYTSSDHVLAHAITRRILSLWIPGFSYRLVHVAFAAGRVALRKGLMRVNACVWFGIGSTVSSLSHPRHLDGALSSIRHLAWLVRKTLT
jgi:hypothetical protein